MTDRIAALINETMHKPAHLSIFRAKYFTLSMKETEGQPLVMRWAKAMVSVMNNIPILILPNELIVGRLAKQGRYGIFYPELDANLFTKKINSNIFINLEHTPYTEEEYDEIVNEIVPYWQGKTFKDALYPLLPPATKKIMFADPNAENLNEAEQRFIISETSTLRHSLQWVLDYKKVLERGFVGIEAEARKCIENLQESAVANKEEKEVFYSSVIIICQGIKHFAERYAQKALELAKNESNAIRQKELLAIAERCNHVPYYPARNFTEAVQSQWFTQLASRIEQSHGGNISNGRIDQFLYPYYIKDKTENDLADEYVKEVLQSLWLNISQSIRMNATPVGSKMYQDHLHWECTTIGGQLADASDATNKLSTLIFDSAIDFPLDFPWLAIRIHRNTPQTFLEHISEQIVHSQKKPIFLNDEEIIPLLLKRGGSLQEALDYSGSGFSEARMINKDTYFTCTTWLNLIAALQMALYDGAICFEKNEVIGLRTGHLKEFNTFSQLWEALLLQINFLMSRVAQQQDIAEDLRKELMAAPLLSSLHDLCMKEGRDITEGKFAELQSSGNIGVVGFANLVDSLAVIKELVFEKQKYSLIDFMEMVQDNYKDNEILRQECLNIEKFGSAEHDTTEIALMLDSAMTRFCAEHKNNNNKNPLLFYVPIAAHLAMGRVTGATPDGRLAGKAFSYGFSPTNQGDFPSPGLVLSSMKNCKDAKLYARGSRVFRLDLPSYIYQTKKGKAAFVKLLRVWCEQKHWFLQVHFSEENLHQSSHVMPSMQKHGLNTNYLKA